MKTVLYHEKFPDIIINREYAGLGLIGLLAIAFDQRKVEEIEKSGIKICSLLCTEEFNEIKSKILFIQTGKLMFNLIISLLSQGNLLVFVPLKEQTEYAKRKWGRTGLNIFIKTLNPYIPIQEVEEIGEEIKDRNVDLIVMDCIGYSFDLKKRLRDITFKFVLLPRSIFGMVLKEVL